MQFRLVKFRASRWVIAATLAVLGGAASGAVAVEPQHVVSQKNQIFTPGQLSIKRGDTVEVINDDGDLLHHLYVSTKQFEFDSGDQEPGAKVDITFSKTGTFDVLCGIHPKMKLIVHVD